MRCLSSDSELHLFVGAPYRNGEVQPDALSMITHWPGRSVSRIQSDALLPRVEFASSSTKLPLVPCSGMSCTAIHSGTSEWMVSTFHVLLSGCLMSAVKSVLTL